MSQHIVTRSPSVLPCSSAFAQDCPGLDIGEREDAAAMYGGTANDDTAHNSMFEVAMKRADPRTDAALS